jgi:chromosome segregation ATPase
MNDMNNNMINNNENNVENQQLMEHIEEINGRFFDLEKEFKFLEKQNKELKRQLQYEKMKNREMKPNDFLIYDNTLKQGKLFLEDQKKKNVELKKIINDLEEQKKASDYKLIEANQKIKRLEKDFNIINSNNNNNKKEENNNDNNDNEITNLKNKIDEYEIANSKLVLDNENLKKKMESQEKEYKNQIKIFVQYKNSEIKTYHNTISQYKDYFKNHKINPNANKQIKNEGNNNVNKNNNNNLDYGTIMVEMSNKDNLIKSLNSKLDKYMNEYKDIIGEKQLVQQKCNEMQFANQKLMNENNDLKEKNENLKTELSNLNQKVKMNKIKYKNNEYIFNQNMTQMKDKLADYKQRIIMLKTKIKELIGDNQSTKLLKQQSNNNYAKNPNFNNFLDIKQIPLTPTQKKKFSGMSHGNIKINKRQEDSSNFGTNEFYYNKMENINNNF